MSNSIAPVAHELCGAPKRQGGTCRQTAGNRTDHPGVGRCWLHGGRSPVKHGRYSTMKRAQIRELIEQHEADPDPLDILPDLAVVRALLQDYIDRYDAWRDALIAWHESFHTGDGTPKPHQVLDIADAYRLASEASKMAERIENIRAKNAITYEQLRRFLFGVESVIREHVRDERTVDRIRSGLLSLRP